MNPDVKKGDKIIVKDARASGSTSIIGLVASVVAVYNKGHTDEYIHVKVDEPNLNGNWTIYQNRQDVFILADRKSQANFLKEKNIGMQKQISENAIEIQRLEDFETEEDYVAHKLSKLLNAKDEKSMAEILKTLKETHYL